MIGEGGLVGDGPGHYTGGPGYIAGAMPDFYSGANVKSGISSYSMLSGGMMPTAMSSGKMMYMNHFNHLNTIEEEKHETQTSNYFKDGESEREDSKFLN